MLFKHVYISQQGVDLQRSNPYILKFQFLCNHKEVYSFATIKEL